MPAPQATLMKQAARVKFASFGLRVPQNWQQPSGEDAEHFNQAFKPEEKTTQPAVGTPPLFLAATMNKYHTDVQKMHIGKIGSFIDATCDAICSAWATWQNAAALTGVVINAAIASLGAVIGPPWTPLIVAQGAKATPMQAKYTQVIANVIGSAWQTYQATIKVPGLPWYPAFATCPAPVAPPTPNLPCPVSTLSQIPALLSPMVMKQQMVGQLADPQAPFHAELFEAICDAFDKMFKVWQTSTLVTNVIGTGPVPTFLPPTVPAGPVVAGVGTMVPGGFK